MCFDSSFLFTLFTPLLACLPSIFSMLWLTSLRPTQKQQGKITLQSCTACSMSLAWDPSYFGAIFGRPYPYIVPWENPKANAVTVWICRRYWLTGIHWKQAKPVVPYIQQGVGCESELLLFLSSSVGKYLLNVFPGGLLCCFGRDGICQSD